MGIMKKSLLILIGILASIILSSIAAADVINPLNPGGYYPSYSAARMNLAVEYNGQPLNEDFYSTALMCYYSPKFFSGPDEMNITLYDPATKCYWGQSYGQRFICSPNECSYLFRYPRNNEPIARLQFFVPELNRTFVSGEIELADYNSYSVNLQSDGTAALESSGADIPNNGNNGSSDALAGWATIILPWLMTIIIEIAAAFLFLRFVKISKSRKAKKSKKTESKTGRILGFTVLANIISWPIAMILFLASMNVGIWMIVPVELLVIVFEAFFIYWTNKKYVDLKKSFWLSAVMNIASALIGVLILAIIYAV